MGCTACGPSPPQAPQLQKAQPRRPSLIGQVATAVGAEAPPRKQPHLPSPTSLSYYGLFNQHYFQSGELEQSGAEVAISARAGRVSVAEGRDDVWLGCFLKSCRDGRPRDSTPIDLAVILDISTSMNTGLSSSQLGGPKSKLGLAREALLGLMGQLRETDRFGLATFNTRSSLIQPLRYMKYIERTILQNSLDGIQPIGAATMTAAYAAASDIFKNAPVNSCKAGHRRLVFITDSHDISAQDADNFIEEQAKVGVFVSMVCLGKPFNSELAEESCRHKGSNYFCIARDEDLRRVMIHDFDFNFIPVAFEVEVAEESEAFDLLGVYGTPYESLEELPNPTLQSEGDFVPTFTPRFSQTATEIKRHAKEFMHISTKRVPDTMSLSPALQQLFNVLSPSAKTIVRVDTTFPAAVAKDGSTSGHLVLLRLKPKLPGCTSGTVRLMLRHTSAVTGVERGFSAEVEVACADDGTDPVLQKAVALQRYMEVCKLYLQAACERHPRLFELQSALSQADALLAEFDAKPQFDQLCPGVREDLRGFTVLARKHFTEVKPGLQPRTASRSSSKQSVKEEALVSF